MKIIVNYIERATMEPGSIVIDRDIDIGEAALDAAAKFIRAYNEFHPGETRLITSALLVRDVGADKAFETAQFAIAQNAQDFKRSVGAGGEVNTPLEWTGLICAEAGEYYNASKGAHEHTPEYELIQLGGIILNILRQSDPMAISDALIAIRRSHHIGVWGQVNANVIRSK